MTKRVAIMMSGGGSNMQALAQSLASSQYGRAVLVVSNVPSAGGLSKAAALGIPTAVVDHRVFDGDRARFDEALTERLLQAAPDVICLAGFMRILTPHFTYRWEDRLLNIHPSLLPKYKGLNTHARAIEAGDAEAGCTVHQVTADLDDGPILGQARVPVLPDDTPDTLAERVLEQEHKLYPAVLKRFLKGEEMPIYLPTT